MQSRSHFGDTARLARIVNRPAPAWLVWMLTSTVLVYLGHRIQAAAHLNHDVSWIVHSAGWLLEGRRFGIDVIDPNPPMIWWLSMPAALITKLHMVTEPTAIRLLCWGYFLSSAALLYVITEQCDSGQRSASTGWRVAVLVVGTLAPAASFGQREYLSALFAMPYLSAAALRADGASSVRRPLAAAAGVLAGIGFAFKPYLLAVPVLVEGYVLVRRGWRTVLRTETIAMGACLVIYAALVVVLTPDYLTFAVPLMKSVYWAFDNPNVPVLIGRYAASAEPFAYGALIVLVSRSWTPLHSVILLAGLGYSISYFVQMKGFVYHGFPVTLYAYVFLGTAVAAGLRQISTERRTLTRPMHTALLVSLVTLAVPPIINGYRATVEWYAEYNIDWGRTGHFRTAVIDLVNLHSMSRPSYFFALSTHLFPGFPTASYSHSDWTGRSATQGILAAFARRDELKDEAARQRIEAAAVLQRRMVVEDMEQRPPDIIFVERNPIRFGLNGRQFDDLAFYAADPGFQAIWRQFVEQEPIGPLRVFVRHQPQAPGAAAVIRPDR